MSTEMSDCSGRVFTSSALKLSAFEDKTGDFCPLRDCFEEPYLNKDIRYVPQITCYKYLIPKSLLYSPDEINAFFSTDGFPEIHIRSI